MFGEPVLDGLLVGALIGWTIIIIVGVVWLYLYR